MKRTSVFYLVAVLAVFAFNAAAKDINHVEQNHSASDNCFSSNINPPAASQIMATSNVELYAYRYLVELYNVGDNQNLLKEISSFYSRYPDSVYTAYVRFMEGNIYLDNGDIAKAQKIYNELLSSNLKQEVMAELLLNYAQSLGLSGDYSLAMQLLQRVDSEMADPGYSAEADHIRADIYYKQGQFYSAEKAYQNALSGDPQNLEIVFSLFSTQVQLRKEENALILLRGLDSKAEIYPRFVLVWLEYLLANDRLVAFDSFLAYSNLGKSLTSAPILEVRIRRSLLSADYPTAELLLKQVNSNAVHFVFYDALIKLNQGQEKAADSLFKILVADPNQKISVAAYLERLKLMAKNDPAAAIEQLNNYATSNPNSIMKAEVYYTLGYFCYQKQDYIEAIKHLGFAKHFDMTSELNARIEILLADAWFAASRLDIALDTYNRYLNLFPEGSARDKAWFHMGFIHFVNKDYTQAKPCFAELIRFHPTSPLVHDAMYYLAEMDFFLANYNLALQNYTLLLDKKPENTAVLLRITQIHYYQGNYPECERYLSLLSPSYEVCILKGSLKLALKDYPAALDQFLLAENFTKERIRKVEAQSYRALCLYQMKRFKEASALYLKLSSEKESPDTYLFLSAKSAFAAQDYHLALQLYDSFVDQHPDSQHFLAALGDIANAYYNMGNYDQAIEDWLSILKRFRNTTQFDESDQRVVRDALVGLELGLKRANTEDYLAEVLSLPETFNSSYIMFELYYLIIKLYADANDWQSLIQTAEKVRQSFPEINQNPIEMLAVTALINLNQYAEADTLLESMYSKNGSNETLLKWADLEVITQNYASALEKYWQSFNQQPSPETWLKMLECSELDNYTGFDNIWFAGSNYVTTLPQANVLRLDQLYYTGQYDSAQVLATDILNNSLAIHDHAKAFLTLGLIDIQQSNYPQAIGTLKRTIVLFPEFPDIRKIAVYHIVKAQILASSFTEAEMHLTKYAADLDADQIAELNQLLKR